MVWGDPKLREFISSESEIHVGVVVNSRGFAGRVGALPEDDIGSYTVAHDSVGDVVR